MSENDSEKMRRRDNERLTQKQGQRMSDNNAETRCVKQVKHGSE